MEISGPSNSFHVLRAYGLSPQNGVKVTAAPDAAGSVAKIEPTNTQRLIAARVDPARRTDTVELSATPASLAMYRHPADRNAAATGVEAGRVIDVKG